MRSDELMKAEAASLVGGAALQSSSEMKHGGRVTVYNSEHADSLPEEMGEFVRR